MKQCAIGSIMISMILCVFGCQTEIMATVVDDIYRYSYENNINVQHSENIGGPAYKDPRTYEQYQMEE